MGQRGPKPKPAALKILAGNPGKRPVSAAGSAPRHASRVRRGRPDRPPELTGEAAREWDRVSAELDAAGILAVADRGILAAYCLAVADMLAARDAINREGRFLTEPVQTSRGELVGHRTRPHPAVKMLADASTRTHRYAEALGLTPSGRARVEGGTDAGAPQPTNEVAAIRDRIRARREANGAG